MKWSLSRIRLSGIGPADARFDPLDLSLTDPSDDHVLDSVFWLANGGGKTLLLRLLFWVMRPDLIGQVGVDDHQASGPGRHRINHLGAFLAQGDTGHIVTEWRLTEGDRIVERTKLVLGLVASPRPGRSMDDPETIRRLWYSIRSDDGAFGADDLEFVIDAHRRTFADYKEMLDRLGRATGQKGARPPLVRPFDVREAWRRHLDDLGLDAAIFKHLVKMNRGEASANNLLTFGSDREFVEWFLDGIIDPESLAGLNASLERVSDKITKLPETERELAFVTALAARLEPLAQAVTRIDAAERDRQAAEATAIALRDRLLAAERDADATSTLASSRAETEGEKAKSIERRLGTIDTEVREIRLAAAEIAEHDLGAAQKGLAGNVARLRSERDAWRLVPSLRRLAEIDGELETRRAELGEAEQEEAPRRARRDEAAQSYRRRLMAEAVVAREDERAQLARRDLARQQALDRSKEVREAEGEAVSRETRRAGLIREGELAGNRRDAVVRAGNIASGETARAARGRVDAAIAAADLRRDQIRERRALIEATVITLRDQDAVDREARGSTATEAASLRSQVEAADRDRAALAAESLVVDLAGVEAPDLDLVGRSIADRIAERATLAARRRIEIAVRAQDDRRALESLAADGLLPPALDVASAVSALEAANIAAVAGTRYLASSVDPSRALAVIAAAPEVVAGVVLTGGATLAEASEALEGSGLERIGILTVADAERLVEVETNDEERADRIVLPPPAAAYDLSAGDAERERREGRVASWDDQEAGAAQEASSLRGLAALINEHLDAWGNGVLAERRARLAGLDERILGLEARILEAARERDSLIFEDHALQAEDVKAEQATRQLATVVAPSIDRVIEDEDAAKERLATIATLEAEAREWRDTAHLLAGDASAATTEGDLAQGLASAAATAAVRADRDAAGVTTVALVAVPDLPAAQTVMSSAAPVARLKAAWETLDAEVRARTSESPTALRIEQLERDRERADAPIRSAAAPVVELAHGLHAGPLGLDEERSRAAEHETELALEEATRAETEGDLAVRQAEAEVKDILRLITEARQPRPEIVRPADRFAADLALATKRRERDELQGDRDVANAAAVEAVEAARQARDRYDVLRGQVDAIEGRFRGAMPEPALAPPFVGEREVIVAAVREAGGRLDGSAVEREAATAAWQVAAEGLRKTLTEERHIELAASPLGRRVAALAVEPVIVATVTADVRTTEARLRAEIEDLRTHRGLLVRELAEATDRALRELAQAEKRSKLPSTLYDWGDQPFLRIRFERPASPDELTARLTAYVGEVANRPPQKRPSGAELLREACERAIVGDFKVEMLKPNDGYVLRYVPIRDTATMSNGQRATAAICLLMIVSNLRSKNRTKGLPGVGVLLLDNPFGNASAGYLVGVQRTVARELGVQLIYTTGVKDYDAIAPFSNPIALANDQARGLQLRYVRAHPELLALLGSRDAVAGHVSAVRAIPRTVQ